MHRTLVLLSAIAIVGCGSSVEPRTPPASETPVQGAKVAPRPAPQTKSERPKLQWPPKFNVEQDAFADIPAAVAALVDAAQTGDQQVRAQATGWLANQGSAAVVPLSSHLHQGKGAAVEIAICYVLGCIDDASVPPLIETLKKSDDAMVQRNAVKYLGLVPTKQAAVMEQKVKTLVDVMRSHQDAGVRVDAAKALAQIGPPASQWAQTPLQAILDDPSQSDAVRKEAGKAMDSVAQRKTLVD